LYADSAGYPCDQVIIAANTATPSLAKLAFGFGEAPADPTPHTTADATGIPLFIDTPDQGPMVFKAPRGSNALTHVKAYNPHGTNTLDLIITYMRLS
jgi:hypothetical protein